MPIIRHLLFVDGFAAAIAGVIVLSANSLLSNWYDLPSGLVLFMGATNLAYASYSLSLAFRAIRPIYLILLLAAANLAWAIVCFSLAWWFARSASSLGMVHLVGEGIFVGVLGLLEYRWRELLRVKYPS